MIPFFPEICKRFAKTRFFGVLRVFKRGFCEKITHKMLERHL